MVAKRIFETSVTEQNSKKPNVGTHQRYSGEEPKSDISKSCWQDLISLAMLPF